MLLKRRAGLPHCLKRVSLSIYKRQNIHLLQVKFSSDEPTKLAKFPAGHESLRATTFPTFPVNEDRSVLMVPLASEGTSGESSKYGANKYRV